MLSKNNDEIFIIWLSTSEESTTPSIITNTLQTRKENFIGHMILFELISLKFEYQGKKTLTLNFIYKCKVRQQTEVMHIYCEKLQSIYLIHIHNLQYYIFIHVLYQCSAFDVLKLFTQSVHCCNFNSIFCYVLLTNNLVGSVHYTGFEHCVVVDHCFILLVLSLTIKKFFCFRNI